jgi:hypothetical protein
VLYQAQENHQRIITTIVGKIETQGRKLISVPQELLDSEKYRPLEGLKDTDNRTHALIGDFVKDLQAQQRRLVEESFKGTENQVRTLVADLVEGMWAQQRCVIGLKQGIEHYKSCKCDVNHSSSSTPPK